VWSFGSHSSGRLGHGDESAQLPSGEWPPAEVFLPRRIEALAGHHAFAVAAGDGGHCAVLTKEEGAYTFGNGFAGRLGHGDTDNRTVPTPVAALRGECIAAVSLGSSHSLFVTVDGRVFACGESSAMRFGSLDSQAPAPPRRRGGVAPSRPQTVPIEMPGLRVSCK
jgi:alpha-tubulin suppressor-like RCC1 family protein